jgi:hypothetical protein
VGPRTSPNLVAKRKLLTFPETNVEVLPCFQIEKFHNGCSLKVGVIIVLRLSWLEFFVKLGLSEMTRIEN